MTTPAAITPGTRTAARRGILIRGALALELAQAVRVVAFDKTGTLPEGKPRLVQAEAVSGDGAASMANAVALQAVSEHPPAQAVLDVARDEGIAVAAAVTSRAVPGRGMAGEVNGSKLHLDSVRWMQDSGVLLDAAAATTTVLQAQGHTVSCLAQMTQPPRLLGWPAFAEQPKPGAAAGIQRLHRRGLRTVPISGDKRGIP